ncbi:MAG: phosphate ABC transporter ATP-binding protein [Deltaproteobacteria bacterium]|nr:phosphate ABC transporter ATP-binding protein [Deltaproteobacteria bacterium]
MRQSFGRLRGPDPDRVRPLNPNPDDHVCRGIQGTVRPDLGPPPKARVRCLDFFYGNRQVLFDNNLEVPSNRVTAIIGPSGCGKSTHLRAYNRIFELYPGRRARGEIMLDGVDVLAPGVDVIDLRRRVGMIFQQPTTFPMSVFDNVAFGLRLHASLRADALRFEVEQALGSVGLWDEVRDRLNAPAASLSGGQQQRLCVARALAIRPELLLMDEPTSAIDPIGTSRIEDLILGLKRRVTVVIVTHNLQQAARVSDFMAFFYEGRVVEFGPTSQVFHRPSEHLTEDYLSGRFG